MEERIQTKKQQGNFKISKKAFSKVITECIDDIDGIECLASLPYNIKEYILKAKKPNKIEIEMTEGTVHIKIGIRVEKGGSVLKLCQTSQKIIKDSVQSITGFTVSEIDIYVKELGAAKEDKV